MKKSNKNKTLVEDGSEGLKHGRRELLTGAALLGGAYLLSKMGSTAELLAAEESSGTSPDNVINTVCLQCNTGCGLKVKLKDGVAYKLEGNPYNPWVMVPPLSYKTDTADAAPVDGSLCPKGQAGIQTTYDPYRIRKVLKRTGPRGSNKWKSVPFDQAITEIVEGGKLFAEVAAERNRVVTGLRDLWALRDADVAKEMSKEVDAIRKLKTPDEKKAGIAGFKKKFAAHLKTLIDPDHPDFGPKNNQVSFVWGRLKGGRDVFIKRFMSDSFGSINAHGHTTVCQGSLYFTGKAMSDQFEEGKFSHGQKFYWQADTANVKFLLAIGSAYIEGGYGPTHHAKKLMKNLTEGNLRLAVVDPRFSKIASKAHKWIPIKPGTEGGFALSMIRWIIENKRFDKKFLECANKAAAADAGEASWTNATWLVKENGAFLRASEVKDGGAVLQAPQKRKKSDGSGEWDFDAFVVLKDGKPVAVDPNDDKNPVVGDVLVNTVVGGIKVKTGLQIVFETSKQKTIDQWAEVCGVKASDIVDLAREFTSHGKQAVADPHRGVAQHTNGFYNVLAVYTLNALVGNWDWKGGLIKASTFNTAGDKEGQPFNIAKLHPKKAKPFGLSIIRHDAKYEDSTIFAGYPAKRNWYPFSSDVYEEILPSMADAYPYATKAMFLYMGAPTYSLPAGHTNIEAMVDVNRVPLIIANDIIIGEGSMYADYIFPDTAYLERWEFHGSHPSIAQKVMPIRQPAIAPIPETVKVFGNDVPLNLEAMILGIAEKLGLPGYGTGGLGKDRDFKRQEDLYLLMAANVAAGDKSGDSVQSASDTEISHFVKARRHLPKSVFEPDRWAQIVGTKWWDKVVYVLNRGGRFQEYDKAFDGEHFKNKYGKLINLYLEKYAKTTSPMTGKKFIGHAAHLPIMDVLGRVIEDEKQGYDLHMITFRSIFDTKSRTSGNYWITSINPENYIVLNAKDAKARGLKDGDSARIVSKSNPAGVWDLKNGVKKAMVGVIQVMQGIRPGVIGFALGKGHWANGASDVVVDGKLIKGDPRRAKGVHANAAMRIDDHLKNTCLLDPVGGSVSFYDTKVKLIKV